MLYVDDDEHLLDIFRMFVEDITTIRVETAISAQDAKTKLSANTYDVIVSDYEMPRMNGIDFLKYVRKEHGDMPYILFTGRGREEVVIQAINNGADFYLQKGGDPESQFAELTHKIRQAVRQRRAQALIRDHERREADILNFLPDATFAVDNHGMVIAWNRAMEKMTGVKSGEILGKDNYEYALPFYHERRPILIDLVLKDDPITAGKYPFITRDGTTLYSEITIPHFNKGQGAALWFTASPLYDTRGNIVGAIESIREITERKQAEYELKNSIAFLNSLIDQSPTPMWISDEKGMLILINKACCELLNIDEADVIGKFSIFDDSIIKEQGFLPQVRDVFEKGLVAQFQISYDTSRLTNLHLNRFASVILDVTIFPVRDSSGKITNAVIQHNNITERKLAEMELAKSEERYRNIVEDQTEFISRFLPDGTHVFVNEAYCRYFGFKRDEILGHRFRPKIPSEDKERVRRFFTSLTTDNPVDSIEHRIIMPDGSIRWQRWSDRAIFNPSGTATEYQSVGRDITKEKATQAALQDSEQRFRKIFENSPVGMALVTPDLRFFSVNPSWVSMTGYSEEELLRMSFKDITHPDYLIGDIEHIQELAAGKVPVYSTEKRYIKKDGSILWGLLKVTTIRDQQGSLCYFAAQIEDITERKKAEASLKESEERYRTVFETTGAATVLIENDATISLANSEFERLSGFLKGEIENKKKWTDFVVKEDLDWMVAQHRLRRHNRLNALTHYEFRFMSRSGDIRNVFLTIDVIPGTTQSVASLLDITERKKVENNLLTANQEYTNLLSQIQDIYYRSDPEGRLVKASQSWATLLGYDDLSDCLGRSIADDFYINPGDRKPFLEEIYKNGKVTDYEVRLKKKDGSPVLVATSSHLYYDTAGIVLGIEGTFRDITGRKQTEDAFRQANKKLTLLSSITRHDIDNQITTLLSFLRILEKKQPDPTLSEYFLKISAIAKRISAMIRFTKEYEKIGIYDPVWLDTRTIIGTATKEITPGTVNVINDLPSGTMVFGDPLIARVFINLMDNAVRHGGKITTIRFTVQESGDNLLIVCEDDGVGIPDKEKEMIFERSYGKHTGMGLFLAREILLITGITIRETGEPGKGARFEITVPKGVHRYKKD